MTVPSSGCDRVVWFPHAKLGRPPYAPRLKSAPMTRSQDFAIFFVLLSKNLIEMVKVLGILRLWHGATSSARAPIHPHF